METRYIKLNYDEALDAKKQFLSSELNILQASKRIRNYKILRKKELAVKNKLRLILVSLKAKVSLVLAGFPRGKGIEIPSIKEREKGAPNISNELQEIREKLARLQ